MIPPTIAERFAERIPSKMIKPKNARMIPTTSNFLSAERFSHHVGSRRGGAGGIAAGLLRGASPFLGADALPLFFLLFWGGFFLKKNDMILNCQLFIDQLSIVKVIIAQMVCFS